MSATESENLECIPHCEDVLTWITVNGLLHKASKAVIDESVAEILKDLFVDNRQLLLFLTKNVQNKDRLNRINDIIVRNKRKYQNRNASIVIIDDSTESNKEQCDNKKKEQDPFNPFTILPKGCICHICGYLDPLNVETFKNTSRKIAISALEEMNKITVDIFNMNELLLNMNSLYHIDLNNESQQIRIHPKAPFYCFYENIAKQHQIHISKQLIFEASKIGNNRRARRRRNEQNINHDNWMNNKHILIDIDSIQNTTIDSILERKRNDLDTFLIFDKQKIVILNTKTVRKYNEEMDTFESLQNYKIGILEYFDVINQNINIIQIILYGIDLTYNMLLEYVQSKYIMNDGDEWYKELKLYLNEMMDDTNHSKMIIYKHPSKMNMINIDDLTNKISESESIFFTFQLNTGHSWFHHEHNTKKLEIIRKLHEEDKNDIFYADSPSFCRNISNVKISFHGNSKLSKRLIEHSFNEDLNENEKSIINIKNVLNNFEKSKRIRINKSSESASVRNKISTLFLKNIISPNYIEIFKKDDDDNSYFRISWNNHIERDCDQIYYSIVSYDTKAIE